MADLLKAIPQTIRAVPVIQAAAYSSGNVVGGLITLLTGDATFGAAGFIQNVTITDTDGLSVPLDVFFFTEAPVGTVTDKTAIALTKFDLQNSAIGVAHVTDWSLGAASTMGVGQATNIAKQFAVAPGKKLYAVIVARGAATWTTVSSIALSVDIVAP